MKKHILVIDDEVIITQLLASLLELSSYKVSIALSGKDGIGLYREDPPDLLIIDLTAPGVDGLAVIGTIKQEYADARLIALSAAADGDALLTKARALGAQVAFAKPIDKESLLDAVAKLLEIDQ